MHKPIVQAEAALERHKLNSATLALSPISGRIGRPVSVKCLVKMFQVQNGSDSQPESHLCDVISQPMTCGLRRELAHLSARKSLDNAAQVL